MKIILFLLYATVLSACVSTLRPSAPPPTGAPVVLTSSPVATAAPGTLLDLKNVNQTRQANEITKTASVSTAQNIGIGQIDLSYQDTMTVGESRTVHLRLTASQQLATTAKGPAKNPSPNASNFVYKFSGNVDLYPVMNAQLFALGFDVNPTGRIPQAVEAATPANWSWIIKAKEPGRQELSLNISIPAVVNGADSELSKNLQDLALVIAVLPQPVSLTDQIMQSLASNAGAIVVALVGLLGTIIGIVVKMRSDKSARKK